MTDAFKNALKAVDREQLQADFDALAKVTDPDKPWTRRSFTPRFLEGRALLKKWFEQAGLTVRLDTAGNMIGRWEGQKPDAPVLMSGSHSDTVPSGGRFDGIAGILCALAAVRTLKAAGYTPQHPIEIVDFLAEEPSEWGLSCIGSRGMSGALGDKELSLVGPDEERLDAAINRIGGDVARLAEAKRDDIEAFVEIHIEQGPVLEAREIPIGIVSGIAGIARLKVRFEGNAAHAGTAPMDMRADASLAASRFALGVRDTVKPGLFDGHLTATTGVWSVEPGGANVVPGGAELIVDIRAENNDTMSRVLDQLATLAKDSASAEDCKLAVYEQLSRTYAVPCDDGLRGEIDQAARALDLETLPLASGAGHDAAFVARIARAAMIFVPSHEGKSHRPDEWTDNEAIARAADVLTHTLVNLDRSLTNQPA